VLGLPKPCQEALVRRLKLAFKVVIAATLTKLFKYVNGFFKKNELFLNAPAETSDAGGGAEEREEAAEKCKNRFLSHFFAPMFLLAKTYGC
jgi:hypothetical protein